MIPVPKSLVRQIDDFLARDDGGYIDREVNNEINSHIGYGSDLRIDIESYIGDNERRYWAVYAVILQKLADRAKETAETA